MKRIAFIFVLLFVCMSAKGQKYFDYIHETYNQNNPLDRYAYTLFPDALVQTSFGDGNGGLILDNVNIHGIGEVLDPKSMAYDQPIALYDPYNVDTVGLYIKYNYIHETGAAPDTLIFQYYTGPRFAGSIGYGRFSSGMFFPKISYDYISNKGLHAVAEYKYILDSNANTSPFSSGDLLLVPTNGAKGINVMASDLFAFTVSYRPGFKYQSGDTLGVDFKPRNPHSKLQIYVGRTSGKPTASDYENSLTIPTDVRNNHSSNGWNGIYIPGNAWNGYNEILESQFHVTKRLLDNDVRTGTLSLGTGYCYHPYPLYIKVPLINEGSADLTSATISWVFNGSKQKDFYWTGRITTGQGENVILDSLVMPVGSNSFKIWSSNPNGMADYNPLNDTVEAFITIKPPANAHFKIAEDKTAHFLFTPDDLFETSYTWSFGDGQPSTDVEAEHQYPQYPHSRNFLVLLTIKNQSGCTDEFDTVISIAGSGIQPEIEGIKNIKCYPNPFTASTTIEYTLSENTEIQMKLYDIVGKEIQIYETRKQSPGDYRFKLSNSGVQLAPGLYMLLVQTNEGSTVVPLVKK